ncbi:formyltransferase family protein [Flavobacterium sp.]|uniref:formyltransferase family protein n=1 Tax=Flavobacterium sp. TaxID=239 RepID=UPI001B45B4D2|nr:formyltransferase family protein [Flavobacterium sp.]MBP6128164.1 hypothetical protein [Flavobacterium sp.]
MKITLFLMTYKGFAVLQSLVKKSRYKSIEKVIIGIDKNVINDYSQDIIKICNDYNIEYKLYNENYIINTNYGIAVSWRWIIDTSKIKLIILHDSILPKYRGFSPLVSMLINGENKIGVSAIFATNEFDKGAIIYQKTIKIEYPIKINQAIEKIGNLYVEIIEQLVDDISKAKKLKLIDQDESRATYSLWRDTDDYFIDWNMSSNEIKRFVDAVGYPYDGAKSKINNNIVRINEIELYKNLVIENRTVGKILFFENEFPIVVCGEGLIIIKDAVYADNNQSILPLNKFRIRFL